MQRFITPPNGPFSSFPDMLMVVWEKFIVLIFILFLWRILILTYWIKIHQLRLIFNCYDFFWFIVFYFIQTRITESSATLIDNLFSSLSSQNSGVIISDISDHFPVCSKFDVSNTRPSKSFVQSQHFLTKEEQLLNIRSKLSEVSWNLWMILIYL